MLLYSSYKTYKLCKLDHSFSVAHVKKYSIICCQILEEFRPVIAEKDLVTARLPANMPKNRSPDILPGKIFSYGEVCEQGMNGVIGTVKLLLAGKYYASMIIRILIN